MKNLAFIDGQNLYLGTMQNNWKVDHLRLRVYLRDKYKVEEAYYFLGYVSEDYQDLYNNLQKAGFIVAFKEHNKELLAKKKGNVDTDIVFEVMKNLIDNDKFDKIILVSGDGDYKKLVDYLIAKDRFGKILFPNKEFASSLYKSLGSEYYDYLDSIKERIKYR
ncbi:MAG: NYN domain-containing protein [bacterium]|nr:NYN domain-containing protein [bacterium]